MLLAKSVSAAAAIDVAELVRAQRSHFSALVGSRVAVHDAKLRLKVASAQAIGLAFYEIATNAEKYRAPSADTGRLDVWSTIDGDTFTMRPSATAITP